MHVGEDIGVTVRHPPQNQRVTQTSKAAQRTEKAGTVTRLAKPFPRGLGALTH